MLGLVFNKIKKWLIYVLFSFIFLFYKFTNLRDKIFKSQMINLGKQRNVH